MISENFNIQSWEVEIIFLKEDFDLTTILEKVYVLGCKYNCLQEIVETLGKSILNKGFTFSNLLKKKSLIIIGFHTELPKLINTIAHESRHL
jgi:hypothetical protein